MGGMLSRMGIWRAGWRGDACELRVKGVWAGRGRKEEHPGWQEEHGCWLVGWLVGFNGHA